MPVITGETVNKRYGGFISMKKILAMILTAILALGCLAGCGTGTADDSKLTVVTTIFPEYDWVMNVIGDNPAGAEVTMLLDNGVDLHSYQPTADDILKIATCEVFIYVGGESDGWVDDALKEAVNKDMIVIDLLDVLGDTVREEELVEGMQEEEHDHEHHDEDEDEDHEHHHDEEGPEYDEHVWLSLKNSAVIVGAISDALQKADPDNAAVYAANAQAYIEKLNVLDERYAEAVAAASKDTVLFGDRFPFRYLADDYGLTYYAAFVGCSAESEASFETIRFLAEKVDELGLNAVLVIESSDQSIARTIVQTTAAKDQQILTMDSMQSVTAKDVLDGVSYLSIMEKNLEVLTEALK